MLGSRGLRLVLRPLGVASVVATLFLACGSAAAGSGPIDLGNLGENYAGANGLNDLDQVVGLSAMPDWDAHAFLWQNGTMTEIVVYPGFTTIANKINNRGQVIGFSYLLDGTHGWLWANGSATDLVPFPGGNSCFPSAINETGVVVGHCWVGTGETHAFVWRNSKMTDLWSLGCPFSDADDVNGRGDVLGQLPDSGPAVCTRRGVIPICFLQGDCGDAVAINDRGQIAGIAGNHAMLWTNGVVTDLGTLGGGYSRPNDLNNDGVVVGYSTAGTPDFPLPEHAFMWDGTMRDLGVLGEARDTASSRANAINRAGDIVGTVSDENGNHAVLWPAADE